MEAPLAERTNTNVLENEGQWFTETQDCEQFEEGQVLARMRKLTLEEYTRRQQIVSMPKTPYIRYVTPCSYSKQY